ncbi:hypothetical protein CR205_08715 [Alteribacter lacisalsi]|uniref:DUF1189 domain-containing protein n=1 Tax=Alteribacter lacisalsi TaxID=2045244 RepID=A0A2W0HNH7_9BACI|nr:DUF1189 domain-containing protein [Alteribacter lacisalsi]PYZ98642.1 hypothetical protein CR205_08715 [Alteribacter lacisalsi]
MNIFKQFVVSLYSPSTIAKFRHHKIGRAIGYVFLLMLIAILPLAIVVGTTFHSFVSELDDQLTDDIPYFEIQDGSLQSNEIDEPYINEEDGRTLIIDPNGEMTEQDVIHYEDALALLQEDAVLITGGVPQESINYNDFGFNITKDDAQDLVEAVSGLLPVIIGLIVVLMYLFYTASKFIGVTFLALIGLIFRKTAGLPNLTYKHLWVLSAFTVTLPTMIIALFNALPVAIPFQFAIYWTIAIVLLFQVLRHIPKPKKEEDTDQSVE